MKNNTLKTMVITLVLLALAAPSALSQVILPRGTTEGTATQLVGWYGDNGFPGMPPDAFDDNSQFSGETSLTVVNTSNTSDVTIHIQLWASPLGSGDPVLDPCVEFNFTDTLTPNDVHNYDLDDLNLNTDPCLDGSVSCNASEILENDFGEDGFFTVTPVVSKTDRRAIAFNHMIGIVEYSGFGEGGSGARFNAMGREARSFIDSSLLPDGTLLDGITGGLVLLQPEVLSADFTVFDWDLEFDRKSVNLVNIMFLDNYTGPFGDYRSQPADASFSPLLFDEFEVPVSCQDFTPTCVINQGINDIVNEQNVDVSPLFDGEICDGNDVPTGWVRLAVTGVSALENTIGLVAFNDSDADGQLFAQGVWMLAEGAKVFPAPATPTPSPSVTPTPSGGGASPTPTGGGDPGGGGGGGGCAIAGPVQAGTALANMLIVLLPGAAFALRRRFAK